MVGDSIDPTSDRAAYRQIADILRATILSGESPPGAKLPSERELMEEYGAARGTVRQAIATLQSEGLVEVQHGRGVFVRRRPPAYPRLAYDRLARHHRSAGKAPFLAEADDRGLQPGVEVLDVSPGPAPADVARRLNLEQGATVLVRRRRYLANGLSLQLATSYLPLDLVRGTPICEKNPGPGGIYARLEELGHRLLRFTEDVSARMPLDEETRLLRLAPGVPVLEVMRTAYSDQHVALEVCHTVMAADRYVLSYELPAG